MCAPIVDKVAKKYNAFIGIVALGLNKGPRADFTQFSDPPSQTYASDIVVLSM